MSKVCVKPFIHVIAHISVIIRFFSDLVHEISIALPFITAF